MLKYRLYVDNHGDYLYDRRFPDGDTVFVDGEGDLVDSPDGQWEVGLDDRVLLVIPGSDGSTWETDGKVVSIDRDDDGYFSLSVTVNWYGAAQIESSQ